MAIQLGPSLEVESLASWAVVADVLLEGSRPGRAGDEFLSPGGTFSRLFGSARDGDDASGGPSLDPGPLVGDAPVALHFCSRRCFVLPTPCSTDDHTRRDDSALNHDVPPAAAGPASGVRPTLASSLLLGNAGPSFALAGGALSAARVGVPEPPSALPSGASCVVVLGRARRSQPPTPAAAARSECKRLPTCATRVLLPDAPSPEARPWAGVSLPVSRGPATASSPLPSFVLHGDKTPTPCARAVAAAGGLLGRPGDDGSGLRRYVTGTKPTSPVAFCACHHCFSASIDTTDSSSPLTCNAPQRHVDRRHRTTMQLQLCVISACKSRKHISRATQNDSAIQPRGRGQCVLVTQAHIMGDTERQCNTTRGAWPMCARLAGPIEKLVGSGADDNAQILAPWACW
eukprot:m.1324564 g.1324564  ORF g.1324564 m.1324564 type:complete len:402 (+) comp24852_c2_seq16:2657-3862(+)